MTDELQKNLKIPKELERIDALRKELSSTDRDDHLAEIDQWEKQAREALIKISLKDNDGIKMLVDHAKQELIILQEELNAKRPDDFTAQGVAAYAGWAAKIHDKRDLWIWFLSFFSDAEEVLKDVRRNLDTQEFQEEENTAVGY